MKNYTARYSLNPLRPGFLPVIFKWGWCRFVAIFFVCIASFCISSTGVQAANYYVNFDGAGETKASYTAGNVTLTGLSWNLNNVLIGTTAGADRFFGSRSSRFTGTGIMGMNTDKTGGAGTITLYHAKYGTDGNSTWMLEVSNDGFSSIAYSSPVITTSSTTLTLQSFTVNVADGALGVRVRISKLSGGANRLNIDSIAITDFVASNTTTAGAIVGSPFCITNAVGASLNVNFTSTGTFLGTNDYTAQLSDATGSFVIPTNIGVLSSSLNAGTIAITIPPGTPSGTGYKVRVTSSSPAALVMVPSAAFAIYLNTPEVSGLTSGSGNTQVTVSWTNPAGCFDQVMIVAQPLTPFVAVPSGTTYTANPVYGLGTAFGSGSVVYYGTGNNVTVTGLTNGTTYYFKAFVVKTGIWSPGIEISDIPNSSLAGDYKTVANGCWAQAAIWQTFNGVSWVAAATPPNSATTNVTVTHTVLVSTTSGSPINVRDLIINSGGKIYADKLTSAGTPACVGNYLTTNAYISVYGTNLQVNGTGQLGNGYQFDWLGLNIEGANVTISGTNATNNAFNISRLRKAATSGVTNCIITLPILNVWWNTASGTSLYNGSTGTFNLTIDQGVVFSTVLSGFGTSGNACINGVNGAGTGDGTFTVNGTLNVPGILYASTTLATAGRSANWVIGTTGVIRCNQISCPASGAAGHNFTIMNGGRLILDNNNAIGTQDPFPGFSFTNNTYNLLPGSIVEYADNAAMPNSQIVNTNLIYSNLVISGNANKTMAADITVNRDLTITGGSLLPGINNIFIGGDWSNYSTTGFLEATSKVIFQGIATQTIYCNGGEDFYNVDITNSIGVLLANDITVQKVLNLTSAGKLIFGAAQHIVTLSDMSAGSDAFLGTGSAYIDLSGANHYLYIGSQFASYSGGFNAGTQSFVVYYRSNLINALGVGGGDQWVIMFINYANLVLIGTDNKYTNNNFTVNANIGVDGSTTVMHALINGKILTLGGNFFLSGGATMNNNCRDNLTIFTSGNLLQTFDANFQVIKCYDLLSTKTAGGLFLTNSSTTLDIKNDLKIDYTVAAVLSDNLNLIMVGDDAELGSAFSSTANFILTGTLEFDAIGANGDLHLSDLSGIAKVKADLNNLTINTGVQTGVLKRVEIMPAAGGQTIIVKGNVNIVQGINGGELDPNANNINVGGNWTTYNETGFEETGSTVMFNGSLLQTIFATTFEQFDFLKINNSSAGVQLLGAVKTNNLNLTLGQLDLNFFRLTITNPLATAITGGSNVSYVKSETALGGPALATNPSILQWNMASSTGNFVFPFGVNSTFIPLTFNKLLATPADIEIATRATTPDNKPWNDVTQVAAVSNMFSGAVNGDGSIDVVIDRWWDVNASVPGITADITFVYRGAENTLTGGYSTGVLAAQNWDGNIWLPPVCNICNNAVLIGTGSVKVSNALLGNTPWVLTQQAAPLPVELLNFTAVKNDQDVLLNWTTASELNTDYFEVYSAFQNPGENFFNAIGKVKGNGTTTINHSYSLTDSRAKKSGIYYYKLKQVDINGSYTFSKTIAVQFDSNHDFNLISVSPNPVNDETTVQIYADKPGVLFVNITDMLGRQISSQSYNIDKGYFTFNSESMKGLNAGLYNMKLVLNNEQLISRLVKD